ncbi:hypothetical protein [Tessaracoccus coleopterorum]|uniref:hypothetical protein n=1 Tax=Tessaracoccus coleopterorum TaxID=2714950 RepID=UPI0018D3FFA2|nr:hypothetical protein [Tessaracoccus coleopterorum]
MHALQNHDELTYELVHFGTTHRADAYRLGGVDYTGAELAERIRHDLRSAIAGPAAPYNAIFTQNGIASTTASVITACLGISDLGAITDDDVRRVRDAHLLLAAFNALQPGVFALSGWDLVGALPVDRDDVADLISTGDTRWIERGAFDLMGRNPEANRSASGLPRARSLYGSLPAQLADPGSFARRLASMLHLREAHGIATGTLLEIPLPDDPAILVMVNRLAIGAVQVSVFNFSERAAGTVVRAAALPEGRPSSTSVPARWSAASSPSTAGTPRRVGSGWTSARSRSRP